MTDVTVKLDDICVYCGSASGADPAFERAARDFGRCLAAEGIGLVYGGGGRGLMGTLAQSVLDNGGRVTGIIPDFLLAYAAPPHASHHQIVVTDFHARKRLMYEHADAIVALPGGIGTLEELVEQLTWIRLGRHSKPLLIADFGGFWRPLHDLVIHMRDHRFIEPTLDVSYLVADRAEDIVPLLRSAAKPVRPS